MDQHRSTSEYPQQSRHHVALREKPVEKTKQQSRHRALFIPKEGKETLEVNLEKGKEKTRSRNQILGSGVDYAKGRY